MYLSELKFYNHVSVEIKILTLIDEFVILVYPGRSNRWLFEDKKNPQSGIEQRSRNPLLQPLSNAATSPDIVLLFSFFFSGILVIEWSHIILTNVYPRP